jgi:hypothetical protein
LNGAMTLPAPEADGARPAAEPVFGDAAFHDWSIAWTAARAERLVPLRTGLAGLARRAAILFRRQGKTVRAAALRRMVEVLGSDPAGRHARRSQWRAALEQRAARDRLDSPAGLFPDLPAAVAAGPRPDLAHGNPTLWEALWTDLEREELRRGLNREGNAGPVVDPLLLDLLIAQAARQIPLRPADAGFGCRAAETMSGMLELAGFGEASAVAAMLAVYFNPRDGFAHLRLGEALAAIDPGASAELHRGLGFRLECLRSAATEPCQPL